MKVSVLINNYNYGKFITETVDSVLSQNHDDVEVIVYDDGSSDDSLEILSRFGDRITVISNPNLGQLPSVNQANAIEEAFKVSTGEIIFLLDSDDLFSENKIPKVLDVYKNNPEVVCVQHTFQLVDKDSVPLKERKRPILSGVKLPQAIFSSGSVGYFFSQTSALAFRRSFMEQVLPLERDDFFMQWPDIKLSRNAMFHGGVYTIQEDLGKYRIHGSNDSDKLKDLEYRRKFMDEHVRFLNKLSDKYVGKKFVYKGKYVSLLNVLLLSLFSSASLKEKFSFIKEVFVRV